MIISTGEDEFLRIWDSGFALIYEMNIRKIGIFEDTPSVIFSKHEFLFC